jgi:hypothetical protein
MNLDGSLQNRQGGAGFSLPPVPFWAGLGIHRKSAETSLGTADTSVCATSVDKGCMNNIG